MPKLSRREQERKVLNLVINFYRIFIYFLLDYHTILGLCNENSKEYKLFYTDTFTWYKSEMNRKNKMKEYHEFVILFKSITISDIILMSEKYKRIYKTYEYFLLFCTPSFHRSVIHLNILVNTLTKCKQKYQYIDILEIITSFEKKELKTSGRELIQKQISMSLPKIPLDIIKNSLDYIVLDVRVSTRLLKKMLKII